MISGAEHYRRSPVRKFTQKGCGPGCAVGMHNDTSNLVKRRAPNLSTVFGDLQKAPVTRQMAPFVGYINNLVQKKKPESTIRCIVT